MIIRRFGIYAVCAAFACSFFSCGEDDDPSNSGSDPVVGDAARTMLVYAVNHSNLGYDFKSDSKEMLAAMSKVDSDKYRLLVYRTDSEKECSLCEARRQSDGSFAFITLKKYPRDVTSTDPERIKKVIDDALSLYPAARHDLMFWGHGMSWVPSFTNHDPGQTVSEGKGRNAVMHSYGGEYGEGGKTKWTEIHDLAAAVPDHRFETIWFDCCYMSGIETIYEFRNKCATFVAYPTEVWQYGLPYDKVLPWLMQETPDVTEGCRTLYNYYMNMPSAEQRVTVTQLDMSSIERLAEATAAIYTSTRGYWPDGKDMVNYSRNYKYPFYDFRQTVRLKAALQQLDAELERFEKAYEDAVVYHAASPKNFADVKWNLDDVSGISTHIPTGKNTPEEEFYCTLSWTKRVSK